MQKILGFCVKAWRYSNIIYGKLCILRHSGTQFFLKSIFLYFKAHCIMYGFSLDLLQYTALSLLSTHSGLFALHGLSLTLTETACWKTHTAHYRHTTHNCTGIKSHRGFLFIFVKYLYFAWIQILAQFF